MCQAAVLALLLVASFAQRVSSVSAAPPVQRYLILQNQPRGVGTPMAAGGYAYGWFGAAYRSHHQAHRGYYGDTYIWRGQLAP
ncbi:MAG: hypothetical protein SGJ20_10885 [Planctomycetota bacterium]|nr:hypothetical protein [Planctomycetota bacterium]